MPHDHWSDMAKYVYHVDKNNVHYLTEERPMPEDNKTEDKFDAFVNVEHKETAGKYMAGVIEDLLPALEEIFKMQAANIMPLGKYKRSSWMTCPKIVYVDAFWRHLLKGFDTIDPVTGKPHDLAIAWNAIVRVWFRLKEEGKLEGQRSDRMSDQRVPYSLRDQKKWESEAEDG